jgi:hypothetical protein
MDIPSDESSAERGTTMPRQAIDLKHVWPLLDSVTRSYATNDLQKRADALIAALVYVFEAIEILEARVAELENGQTPKEQGGP